VRKGIVVVARVVEECGDGGTGVVVAWRGHD